MSTSTETWLGCGWMPVPATNNAKGKGQEDTMKRTKFKTAAFALAGALALLMPVTAAARDRDDFHRADRGRVEVQRRDVRVYRGGRDDHWRDRDRFRGGVYFNYAPAPVVVPVQPQGYYDAYGYWHAY